jgi:putative sigma-54 modulation protein
MKENVMRLEVKGRNVEVNDSIRGYAEEKFDRIARQLPEETQIEVELALETNPSISEDHIAEATVWTKGSTLRVRETSNAFETSIDQLSDKLERQVKRYREKRSRRETGRRANGRSDEPTFSGEQLDRMIVKSKQFELQPLTPDEAAVELELIGHDFFVFTNTETGQTNVVYRRRAGAYGLIEPTT